jgi:hypothetical protein
MATSESRPRTRVLALRGYDRIGEALDRSHNKHMLRAGTHKVLGRGRPSPVPCSAPRGGGVCRVLTGQLAGADVGR